jgi:hypothetical protein
MSAARLHTRRQRPSTYIPPALNSEIDIESALAVLEHRVVKAGSALHGETKRS